MKNVGIHAAMTLAEIGTASDINGFFNLVVTLLKHRNKGSKYPWVTENLYRRSLKYEELSSVKRDLDSIERSFSQISAKGIDWMSLGVNVNNTKLNLKGESLSIVFKRLFSAFSEALECTEVYYQELNEYIPVRIGFTDTPYYIDEINRPLEKYDALGPDDPPFWLR
ncbi:hypothetical protein B0X70_18120 [Photorhabdus akhurstii]|uniref:Uncharacterized protein n=1 Tax=Photorhabdus akhurstii TaxID=171438 RepID=A0ABX8LX67_9GAMM|nr:Imm70 family immunity protein [Photorhabdus akhurstii]QXF34867.1 hypothetical protein B0X70_18120 [Photorhabdus akhurstii]